jgi:hypothetical protein
VSSHFIDKPFGNHLAGLAGIDRGNGKTGGDRQDGTVPA